MPAVKIDLHTHTCCSPDAFTTIQQLEKFFRRFTDFIIAITDHNVIEMALQARERFGEKIIVGEEIKTAEGEIVGLYLNRFIEPDMSVGNTAEEIKRQGGIIMVPHPFKRTGNEDSPIKESVLDSHAELFDIIEIYNARNRTKGANERAVHFAQNHHKHMGVGSDAHAVYELARTYSTFPCYNGKDSLLAQLAMASHVCQPITFLRRLITRIQREMKRCNT